MDTIASIPTDQLHESPFNPRKTFNEAGLGELAADIRKQGVLSPLLVRPRIPPLFRDTEVADDAATGYEIVFGHRRFRAAQLAELQAVPCMVRSMDDLEAKRAQISENLAREDLHPIEEGEAFAVLLRDHGMSKPEIAAEYGKSLSYIYGRLELANLHDEPRAAFLRGEMSTEIALYIARMPSQKNQQLAMAVLKEQQYHLGQGERNIRARLIERFTLTLKDAIFDREDADLLPFAGACSICPKRSGNAPEFSDLIERPEGKDPHYTRRPGPDVCTDPDCFAAKKTEHLRRKAEALEAEGKVVVDGNKARAAVSASGEIKGAFIALKDAKEAIKASGAAVQPVTIQDPRTGKLHQAVKREDLKAAGVKLKEQPKAAKTDYQAEQRKREEEWQRKEAAARAEQPYRLELLKRVREVAHAAPRTVYDMQLIAQVALEGCDWSGRRLLAELWGHKDYDKLQKRAGQLSAEDISRLLLDCALVANVATTTSNYAQAPEPLTTAAKHYGIDVAALRAELSEPASTPSPAARAPKGAKAAPATKKTPASKKASSPKPKKVQTVDAGVAGGADAQAALLVEAEQ